MEKFNKPEVEVIVFSEEESIVTASNDCTTGMENTGWQCGGDVSVTCATSTAADLA